jgi:ABC-type transport system involved in multi-copper enzyme maturation permease subunit
MPIVVIMRLTLREAVRRKVMVGLLILSAIFLVLYTLGLVFINNELAGQAVPSRIGGVETVYNFLLVSGLYAANFLLIMLAVLISVDTLAGEISSGTIQSLAVKPLARREILIGKWLGFVILLGLSVLLLVGGVMLITWLITGYTAPNWPSGLLLQYLQTLVLLSVSLLGGTRLSTLANGVLGFGLFGMAFVGGLIGQVGTFISNTTVQTIGQLTALLMPTEALWRRTLSEISVGFNPFRFMYIGGVPEEGVWLYAAIYAAVMLLIALWSFGRRDL